MNDNRDHAYHSQNTSSTDPAMMRTGRLTMRTLLAISQIPALQKHSIKESHVAAHAQGFHIIENCFLLNIIAISDD